MADIFLSHAGANKERVRHMAELLMEEGYEVWWDGNLPPHRSYSEVIQEEIAQAKVVLVAWSKEGVASEWVRAEADIGRATQKLVQVALDSCLLPLPFNQIHVVSLTGWRGGRADIEWQLILRSIADLIAKPHQAQAEPGRTSTADPPPKPLRRRIHIGRNAAALVVALLVGIGIGFVSARSWFEPPAPHTRKADTSLVDSTDVIFRNSDSKTLTEADLAHLTKDQLRIARSEIYARYGVPFRTPELRAHFCQVRWYRANYGLRSSVVFRDKMSPIERHNVDMLKARESQLLAASDSRPDP